VPLAPAQQYLEFLLERLRRAAGDQRLLRGQNEAFAVRASIQCQCD
jgi:hypothetical protein